MLNPTELKTISIAFELPYDQVEKLHNACMKKKQTQADLEAIIEHSIKTGTPLKKYIKQQTAFKKKYKNT